MATSSKNTLNLQERFELDKLLKEVRMDQLKSKYQQKEAKDLTFTPNLNSANLDNSFGGNGSSYGQANFIRSKTRLSSR